MEASNGALDMTGAASAAGPATRAVAINDTERTPSQLDELRGDIDSIDDGILQLLEKRAGKALEVARVKQMRGWSTAYDPERERRVLARLTAGQTGPLSPSAVGSVFEQIITACRSIQQSRWGGLTLPAFEPRQFRDAAELAIDKLQRHLGDSTVRGLALTDPAELQRAARALMAPDRDSVATFDPQRLNAILDLYIRTGIQLHSPGYMGRQYSGPVPLAAVIDFVGALLNQPSSFYEAAQLPSVAERLMAEELNRFIGWDPERFTMVTTSGGSLANLTALLAARNARFPGYWTDGGAAVGSLRPAVAIGDDAHYSITRAAGILGIGEAQLVRLPLDAQRRISMPHVRPALAAARDRGLSVFCLVASAGTTSVGAFDPLDELAQIAREHALWLHVDGAHGASLLVSDKQRPRLAGIEQADSLAWDAHKLMFVPAACTLLFYKNKATSYGAFRQTASYVFEREPDIYTELDSAEKNFECTKRPLIMSLWVLWAMYGRALFARKIDYLCQLTEQAYQVLHDASDFEPLHRPESNILCFRYLPPRGDDAGIPDLQIAIRNRVRQRGQFFISKITLDGRDALRVVMMNHDITIERFCGLLDEIRAAARSVLDEHRHA